MVLCGCWEQVRGDVVMSWSWHGAPMQSTFTLNCTIPPNVHTTVVIPTPGLATPTVSESGSVVWDGAGFVRGVLGVTAASMDAGDATIVFVVGSGSYSFVTSAASAKGSLLDLGRESMVLSGCNRTLECPVGSTIARVVRAGLADVGPFSSFKEQHFGWPTCSISSAAAARCAAWMPRRRSTRWPRP
jgi:hypothetical protein